MFSLAADRGLIKPDLHELVMQNLVLVTVNHLLLLLGLDYLLQSTQVVLLRKGCGQQEIGGAYLENLELGVVRVHQGVLLRGERARIDDLLVELIC